MDILAFSALTLGLSKAGLSAGTTTTISTANTYNYAINSKAYTKGAITNGATPTTDSATGAAFPGFVANQGTIVVLGLDASGNVKAVQGSVEALDVSGNFIRAPLMPPCPDNFCPFGYIVLKGGSTLSGTFTFGSSNLSGVTGMTYTFQDVIGWPARPQVS